MTHLNNISKVYLEQVSESAVPGKPAERLGAVTAIPKSEQDAARERILAKTKAKREAMKEERNDEPGEGKKQKYGDMRGLDRSGPPMSFGGKWQSKERKAAGAAALAKLNKEALDPVGKEDADIDNDNDVDNSDKYLHKKRKAIGKAIGKDEECEKCGKKKCECDSDKKVDEIYMVTPPKKTDKKKVVTTTIDKYGNRVKVKESKNVHGEIEIPSGDLKKLVAKAVERIDTDVDGDVEHNDKHKGEYGEFVPTQDGNGRVFTGPNRVRKESFSNWREDLIEVSGKIDKKMSEKKSVDNSSIININPELKESIAEIGGNIIEYNEVEYSGPVDIFEDVTDAEMYFIDEDFIYNIVEESIVELLDEGYDIDHIVDSIVESVDNSLQVLEEDVAATAARKRAGDTRRAELRTRSKTMRSEPAAMRRNQRMNAVKSAAKKVGSAVKRAATGAAKGTAYGAGYAAGTAVRGARAIARKAGEGYKRGVQGSGSSSGSSTYAPSSRDNSERGSSKPGMLSRVGSALNKGIKGAVRVGARLVRSGATSVAKGAKKVEKRMSEEARNPYAIGMAAAMKSTGDTPPLKKSTIKKAHKIADRINANEENEMSMSPQEVRLQQKKSKIDIMIAKAKDQSIKKQS